MQELPLTITGRVIPGAQQARQFGYPTANVDLGSRELDVTEGVYRGYATVAGSEERLPSIVFYGTPHFLAPIVRPRLEVHVLGRDIPLDGTELTVEIQTFVRENRKFPTIHDLQLAIAEDVNAACAFFKIAHP